MDRYEIIPGVIIEIDPNKFTIERGLTLKFPEGSDLRIHLDARITDVLSKTEQPATKIENLVILRGG